MKVFGYRSKKNWKMFLATMFYGFILMIIIVAIINPESDTEKDATPEVVVSAPVVPLLSPAEQEALDKVKAEEKAESDRLAEEKRIVDEKEKAIADRKKKIDSQFSLWNGSHDNLTAIIKKSMNDPKSYSHDETIYWDREDHLIVQTTFRGKNAFGGVVKNSVKAKVSLDGVVLEILEQQ